MNQEDRKLELYSQLLVISQEALTNGYYEAAYHALTAALHCAQTEGDIDRLEEVAKLAGEQLAYINRHAPNSVMSTQAATSRRGVDMYAVLRRMSNARAQMVRDAQRRAEIRRSL
jgi:hypothetical protein